MNLFLNSETRIITDEKDRTVHVDNAKAFWLDGKVDDCNLSFERLANFGFDFERLENFYAECDK